MAPSEPEKLGDPEQVGIHADANSAFSQFFNSALSIVEAATKMGIELRLLGATAIYYQCPNSQFLSGAMQRLLTDLDFMTLSKHVSKIPELFASLNFLPNERVNALYGAQRQIYFDSKSSLHVDIFFDKLSFNHVIDLSHRLRIDPVTISLADLLLEKLQIVKISEKDAKDVVVLVREHDLGTREQGGTIDVDYIAKLLSDDWGFYHTVRQNAKKVMEFATSSPFLTQGDRDVVNSRLGLLLQKLESSHKSLKWMMRAKIGTKARWYSEAEDVENR